MSQQCNSIHLCFVNIVNTNSCTDMQVQVYTLAGVVLRFLL